MALKTLLELRNRAKEHADKVSSPFVSTSVWNGWINETAAELWDLIISANEDYETITEDFTISSGNTRALPSDFYKLRGLDKEFGGRYLPIKRYKFEERGFHQYTNYTSLNGLNAEYRVIKNNLVLLPSESAAGNYRLWYVPIFPELVDDTDELDGRNGWDSFITLGAAIFALAKEESDTSTLQNLKDRALQRILNMSSSRDMSEPKGIVRTTDKLTYDDL